MPGGSDRDPSRQLKVPPSRAVRRSSSNSPIPPPKLPAARTVRRSTSNSPIPPSKVPAQSPIGTRSQVQKQSVSTMALSDFTSLADRLSQFEAKLGAASIVEEDVYALEIRRNRITSLWEKIDDEYGRCSKDPGSGPGVPVLPEMTTSPSSPSSWSTNGPSLQVLAYMFSLPLHQ
ncbi:hypothetical protein ACLKA7_001282 [Drosophila subpalustris]